MKNYKSPDRDSFSKIVPLKEEKVDSINKNPYLPMFPSRILLTGSSGSGKTTLLLNLLLRPKISFDYDYLYFFARSLQSCITYKPLIELAEEFPDNIFLYESVEDLPEIESFPNETKQTIVVFDDFAADPSFKNAKVKDLLFRGRHKKITTIITTQSFFDIPKAYRNNISHIALFPGSANNTRDINMLANFCCNIESSKFRDLYLQATLQRFNFLWIDKESLPGNNTFRFNLDQPISMNYWSGF